MTVRQEDLLGSWELIDIVDTRTGEVPRSSLFGSNPQGILHYLANGRMAVMIQHPDRQPIDGGRTGGNDEAWRKAARAFTAYGGTYTIEPERIVHHVAFDSFPNGVGTDRVRLARLDGDMLVLEVPPGNPDESLMRLRWKRLDGAAQ